MSVRAIISIALMASTTACMMAEGPTPLIDRYGAVYHRNRHGSAPEDDKPYSEDPGTRFFSLVKMASNDPSLVPQMQEAGFLLAYTRCNDFFNLTVNNQIG